MVIFQEQGERRKMNFNEKKENRNRRIRLNRLLKKQDRLCGCGCGKIILAEKKSSKKYHGDACKMRAHRMKESVEK